jgi:omega-amidase
MMNDEFFLKSKKHKLLIINYIHHSSLVTRHSSLVTHHSSFIIQMNVSILQSALCWENKNANLEALADKIAPMAGKTDLIVLPEMFTTGFTMNTSLAEDMQGPTVQWMRAQAKATDAAVTGSFICSDHGAYYNRLVWATPDGQIQHYDKRHLFGLAAETQHFSAGRARLIVSWKGWRICPLICYDLRFPAWSRNQSEGGFDLLLYVANWPRRRAHHWKSLLTARAIENQCFTVGVNIFGTDGNGLEYSGDSAIIDFSGHLITQISEREGIQSAELSLEDLHTYRKQLPFLQDRDFFELK